jgi:hypothetical protein
MTLMMLNIVDLKSRINSSILFVQLRYQLSLQATDNLATPRLYHFDLVQLKAPL